MRRRKRTKKYRSPSVKRRNKARADVHRVCRSRCEASLSRHSILAPRARVKGSQLPSPFPSYGFLDARWHDNVMATHKLAKAMESINPTAAKIMRKTFNPDGLSFVNREGKKVTLVPKMPKIKAKYTYPFKRKSPRR